MSEGDEPYVAVPGLTATEEDNSLGRLLALADGVFAIAITLLALDLKVPDLGSHPSNSELVHALGQNSDSYWSFLLTFYVIAQYWVRHRRLLRSVTTIHPLLIRDTLFLLLIVAAMPFPASLLGRYGSDPISLVIYGTANVLAMLAMVLTSRDLHRLHLVTAEPGESPYHLNPSTWLTMGVFLLCIPAGYVLGSKGPYVLLLLLVPDRLPKAWRLARNRATGRTPKHD